MLDVQDFFFCNTQYDEIKVESASNIYLNWQKKSTILRAP